MSAQIRRQNDRSKLVEQEFGRRMYATDLPYEEAMDQLTQKHLDTVKLIKQSEFKKPYLEDAYVPMEYGYNPPDWPDFAPVNPGDSIIPDCRVGVEAAGALENWRECDPENDCAGWVFTCAHKLISVGCGNCTITQITPLEGDRLMVIICSDQDALDIKVQTTEDPSKPAAWKSFTEKRTCCPTTKACGGKCEGCPPPVIGYTSQQMSCSGTQTLTHASGGAGGPYTWSTDYGSFSAPTGPSVVFTAPSANANCGNNPTITLTDCCNHTATLQIAVNCYSTAADACSYYSCTETCPISPPCANPAMVKCKREGLRQKYDCDGNVFGASTVCGASSRTCADSNCVTCLSLCDLCTSIIGQNCPGKNPNTYYDDRTQAMKDGGCCPAQLL